MKLLLKVSAAVALSVVAGLSQPRAQTATPSPLVSKVSLRWDMATAIAAEAVKICEGRGYMVTAVVVDRDGQQQVFISNNAAPPHTHVLAYRKAYTINSFGPPRDLPAISSLLTAQQPSGPLDGILNRLPDVMFVAGGVLLKSVDGQFLGGLGVSGSPGGDKDEACASEAIKKFQDQLK